MSRDSPAQKADQFLGSRLHLVRQLFVVQLQYGAEVVVWSHIPPYWLFQRLEGRQALSPCSRTRSRRTASASALFCLSRSHREDLRFGNCQFLHELLNGYFVSTPDFPLRSLQLTVGAGPETASRCFLAQR